MISFDIYKPFSFVFCESTMQQNRTNFLIQINSLFILFNRRNRINYFLNSLWNPPSIFVFPDCTQFQKQESIEKGDNQYLNGMKIYQIKLPSPPHPTKKWTNIKMLVVEKIGLGNYFSFKIEIMGFFSPVGKEHLFIIEKI